MGLKDFQLKWVHELSRSNPAYISNNKVLVPSSFSIKTCDLNGNNSQYHFEPKIKIGCCCTLLELGIVAVSERKTNGAIHILSYPEMTKLSVLEQNNNEPYSSILFSGVELLISLQIKNCYEIDLWKWSSGERIHFISIPILNSEVPDASLFINPLWWYQVLLQCNTRFILLTVKQVDNRFVLDASSYFFMADKKNEVELAVKNEQSDKNSFQIEVVKPMLDTVTVQSVCWFPQNKVLAATSKGVFNVDLSDCSLHKLIDTITGVSSMVLSKSGLFIGYKSGHIDIVNIVGNRWNLIETLSIDQPINHLLLSPDYKFLLVTTVKGSIFYRHVLQEKSNFSTLLPAEFGGEVAVKFVGPFANVCVVAKKNGFVHLFRVADGSILSTFQIEEEIVCLETSPSCYCIVIGTNLGFLYFFDATDTRKPRFVHCERPYEISIDNLKFDNFGHYLVSSAQNQPIKIWNGLPLSDFRFLGLKRISNHVKDFSVFCRSEDSETVLFILAECGNGSAEEMGTVLMRLELPLDFGSDSQKYQINVFGTLSDDVLKIQERRLDMFFSKIEIHETLGVFVYAPSAHIIHKYSIWSDFANAKQDDILSIKNVHSTCMSPDHLWIAATDLFGCVYFYSNKEFVLVASSQKYCAAENTSKSSVHFPLSSNRLLCGRETGTVQCFEWVDDSNFIRSIPEWVAYCFSKFEYENNALRSMDEEGRLDMALRGALKDRSESLTQDEFSDEIKVVTLVLNFYLEKCLEQQYSSNAFLSFILNDDVLEKLSRTNRKKLQSILSEKNSGVEKNVDKSKRDNATKVLSSFSLGFVTQNYSKNSIDRDFDRIKRLSSISDEKVSKKPPTNWSFLKSVKTKNEGELLETLNQLINEICIQKTEFNKKFNCLNEAKANVDNRLENAFFQAKVLAHSLPSKAERDFWSASVIESYSGRHFESVENQSINTKDQNSDKDSTREAKSSIEFHSKSARDIRDDFDSEVEALLLKKRFCDCKIYKLEVKVLTILLFASEHETLSSWREDAEKELKCIEAVRKDVDEFRKEVFSLEKKAKDLYQLLQKTERTHSHKIHTKCLKFGEEKALMTLQKQPTLQLDDKSENPFWRSCSTIQDDLTIMSKISFPNPFPKETHKTEWASLCNKQIVVFKIGVVMRNVQAELMAINEIKQACAVSESALKTAHHTLQKTLKDMTRLVSKCSMVSNTLLTTQLECMDIRLSGDPEREIIISNMDKIPSSDHKIWKEIDHEAGRIKDIQVLLEKIERIFGHLRQLKSGMVLTVKNIKKEHEEMIETRKEKFEERKQHFLKAKMVAEDILAENKKSMFKTLKSRILTESSGRIQ